VVSRRAAEAYIKTGVRLESSCGISDVWYRYVELNSAKFGGGDSGVLGFSSFTSTNLSPNEEQMELVGKPFDWKRLHSRPLPTKIRRVVETSGAESKTYVKKETGTGDGVLGFSYDMATGNRDGGANAEGAVSECLIQAGNGLIIGLKQKADGSEAMVQATGGVNVVNMDVLKPEVGGMGLSIEVKGGGNEKEVRKKPGNVTEERAGGRLGSEGEGEKSDSSEFFFEDWPKTASFEKEVGNVMSEVDRKSLVEGVEKRGEVAVRRSEGSGENGEKIQKRGLEDDQDCKECDIFYITFAEVIFAADEVTPSSPWRASRSQKKQALGMLVKKRKERK